MVLGGELSGSRVNLGIQVGQYVRSGHLGYPLSVVVGEGVLNGRFRSVDYVNYFDSLFVGWKVYWYRGSNRGRIEDVVGFSSDGWFKTSGLWNNYSVGDRGLLFWVVPDTSVRDTMVMDVNHGSVIWSSYGSHRVFNVSGVVKVSLLVYMVEDTISLNSLDSMDIVVSDPNTYLVRFSMRDAYAGKCLTTGTGWFNLTGYPLVVIPSRVMQVWEGVVKDGGIGFRNHANVNRSGKSRWILWFRLLDGYSSAGNGVSYGDGSGL